MSPTIASELATAVATALNQYHRGCPADECSLHDISALEVQEVLDDTKTWAMDPARKVAITPITASQGPEVLKPADHDERLAQARSRAGWELGDPGWADTIIAAYLDPRTDEEKLTEEQG